jgi:hypothetical protein
MGVPHTADFDTSNGQTEMEARATKPTLLIYLRRSIHIYTSGYTSPGAPWTCGSTDWTGHNSGEQVTSGCGGSKG